jgi:hypothetical protein
MIASSDNNGPIEYIGHLKFEAQEYDLKSLPTNERAAQDAADIMPLIRTAAVTLLKSADELEAIAREPGGVELQLDLIERLQPALDHKQQEVDILNAAIARLIVACERVIGEDVLKPEYERGRKQPGKRRGVS